MCVQAESVNDQAEIDLNFKFNTIEHAAGAGAKTPTPTQLQQNLIRLWERKCKICGMCRRHKANNYAGHSGTS